MSDETKPDLAFLEPFKKEPCGRPNCKYCEYESPMWDSIHAILNTEQSKFLENFEMEAAYDSTDAAWGRAILDGDWPSSVEILEQALVKAKAFAALSEEEQAEYWANKTKQYERGTGDA